MRPRSRGRCGVRPRSRRRRGVRPHSRGWRGARPQGGVARGHAERGDAALGHAAEGGVARWGGARRAATQLKAAATKGGNQERRGAPAAAKPSSHQEVLGDSPGHVACAACLAMIRTWLRQADTGVASGAACAAHPKVAPQCEGSAANAPGSAVPAEARPLWVRPPNRQGGRQACSLLGLPLLLQSNSWGYLAPMFLFAFARENQTAH